MKTNQTKLHPNLEPGSCKLKANFGFTLMEIVVSLAIFTTTVTMILVIFNFVLRIQRQTDASRQVAQVVRNFAESVVKDIRNGRLDYGFVAGTDVLGDFSGNDTCEFPETLEATFATEGQSNVSLVNLGGERVCIFLGDGTAGEEGNLYIQKSTADSYAQINPDNVTVNQAWFYVRPIRDPYISDVGAGGLSAHQPLVTVLLDMSVSLPGTADRRILYQTSVSTYQYDIPHD